MVSHTTAVEPEQDVGVEMPTHAEILAEVTAAKNLAKWAIAALVPVFMGVVGGALTIRDAVHTHDVRIANLETNGGKHSGFDARLTAVENTRFTQADAVVLKDSINTKLDIILREVRDLSARVAVTEDRTRRGP